MLRVLAVDLGATSVRVAEVDLEEVPPQPRVVHRWRHGPVQHPDGHLHWDWDGIMSAVRTGLDRAIKIGPAASIGVDAWGVDYGLLGRDGTLLSPPFSYRDRRTQGWQTVVERIGREKLYLTTGIQLMPINTIFQLAVHDRRELRRAAQVLTLPDLVAFELTSQPIAERTSAGTTALVDIRTGTWAPDLLDAIGVSPALMPPIRKAGERLGVWRGIPVHLTAGHDTASAFLATPGIPGSATAIVSSGTWVLVGAERPEPDVSLEAVAANFSNEPGAFGGIRFLKNVMGFWMLERCRAAWGGPPIEQLLAAAEDVPDPIPLVDATDQRFLSPLDMEAEVRAAAGLRASASPAVVTRCILESIAAATAGVVEELGSFLQRPAEELFVIGGAAQMELMNRLYQKHTGLPVRVGAVEATALGNALAQGIALGYFNDLQDARVRLGP